MCVICDVSTTGGLPELTVDGGAPEVQEAVFSGLAAGTYDDIADYLTDGFWNWFGTVPRQWDISSGDSLTINITGLTTEGQDLARLAFEYWTDVSGIEFVETSGAADITFDDEDSGAYATSVLDSNNFITSAEINVDKGWFSGLKTLDTYTFQTYIHEIGHALGLGHAGPYNGSANFPGDAEFANDSWQGSIMSYFSQTENPNIDASYAFAVTPMIADIIAIQDLYGAPTATRDGDTVYGNNSNAGGIYDADTYSEGAGFNTGLSFTIYDTGGTDWLDYSGFTEDQVLNLRAEGVSSVMGWEGNVVIARGVVIENAKGGDGDDQLFGNDANNRLVGMDGADEIHGDIGGDDLQGRGGDDVIYGDRGFDLIRGAQGADVLFGGWGGDDIYGGAGTDVAGFTYDYDEYTITENANGSITVEHTGGNGFDGLDTLWDIELLRFNDRQVAVDPLEGPFDFVFLQDLSGSFSGDLPNLQNSVGGIMSRISDDFAGTQFAASSLRDGGVYQADQVLTPNQSAIQTTFDNYTANGDEREAVLGSLVNASNGVGLNLRSGADNLVLVATDEGYRDNQSPDFTSIADARAALEATNTTPIFAVTGGLITEYQDLVDQLGRGVVVEISSNSDDFADAVRFAISQLNGEVTEAGDRFSDIFVGTDSYDGIFGLGGDDEIDGLGGKDILDGGADDDTINGGDGIDELSGGSGDDVLNGNSQSDEIFGGGDDDFLIGGRGFDSLEGGNGDDTLFGSRGEDTLRGGEGNDTLNGGEMADNLFGNAGIDTVTYLTSTVGVDINLTAGTASGGEADGDRLGSIENLVGSDFDDILTGDAGANEFLGGDGLDRLNGFAGDDYLDGGSGDDIIRGGAGDDLVIGRDGADEISGGDGDNVIDAGEGDDAISGGSGVDDVIASGGADSVFGFSGDDILRGNGGDDFLVGNQGADLLFGGFGNDDIRGGQGDDDLDGAEGDDILAGYDGIDVIIGGSGSDTAVFTGDASDYTILSGRGALYIVDTRTNTPDGLDVLSNIETLRFADGDVAASSALTAAPDPGAEAVVAAAAAEYGMTKADLSGLLEDRLAARDARLEAREGPYQKLYGGTASDEGEPAPGEDGSDGDGLNGDTITAAETAASTLDETAAVAANSSDSATGAVGYVNVPSDELFQDANQGVFASRPGFADGLFAEALSMPSAFHQFIDAAAMVSGAGMNEPVILPEAVEAEAPSPLASAVSDAFIPAFNLKPWRDELDYTEDYVLA